MRAAGRHTVPPGDPQAGPTARLPTRIPPRSPGNRRPPCDQPHLAAPAIAVHHATSPPCRPGNRRPPCDQPTLQPRQPPPAMRPASPCSPGNCRPPCDQPTLQTRQPPSARHAALLHTGPTAAARRRRSSREADGCFTAPPPLHSQKGQRGQPKGPAVGRGRGGEGSRREGVAEGRGRGGKGLRKGGVQSEGPQPYPAGTRRESDRVFRRLCTICKPKYTF